MSKIKVQPTILPAIIVNNDEKITVMEHQWDGSADHFALYIEEMKISPMVHLRSYKFNMTDTKKAIVYVLADDRIDEKQLAEVVTSMGPWFYTYGFRTTDVKKAHKKRLLSLK